MVWVLATALKLNILSYQCDCELCVFPLVRLSFCLRYWEDRSSSNSLHEIPIPASQMEAHHGEPTQLHYSQQHAEQGFFSARTEKHPHSFYAFTWGEHGVYLLLLSKQFNSAKKLIARASRAWYKPPFTI